MTITKFFSTILATLIFITAPSFTSISYSETYIMNTSGFGLRMTDRKFIPCMYLPEGTPLFDTSPPEIKSITTYTNDDDGRRVIGHITNFTKVVTQFGATLFVKSSDLDKKELTISQKYSIKLEEAGEGLNTDEGEFHKRGDEIAQRNISPVEEKIGKILQLLTPRIQTSSYVYRRTYGDLNASHKFYLLTVKDLKNNTTNSYAIKKIVTATSCGGAFPRLTVNSITICPCENNELCPLKDLHRLGVTLSQNDRHHPELFDYTPEPSLFSVNNSQQHEELTAYLSSMLFSIDPLVHAVMVNFSSSCSGIYREGNKRREPCFIHRYILSDEPTIPHLKFLRYSSD